MANKKQFSIYLDESEKTALEQMAAAEDRSLNQYVARILRGHLVQTSADAVPQTKCSSPLGQQPTQFAA